MKSTIGAIALVWLGLAGIAFAAGVPCPAPSQGKPLAFDLLDSEIQRGLSISFLLGLEPSTFPTEDIAKQTSPCKRGTFSGYQLLGDDETLPPRWAVAPGAIAYLVLAPKPAPAEAWRKRYLADKKAEAYFGGNDMMYYLTVTDGANRKIYRFYDGPPADAALAQDMCDALSDALPVLATFDVNDRHTSFPASPARNASKACPLTPPK